MAKRLDTAALRAELPQHRNRTSLAGCLRIDRKLHKIGVGRLQLSSETVDQTEFRYRNAIITKLVEDAELVTLCALRDGELSMTELAAAQRQGRLAHALEDARARRAARPAANTAVPSTSQTVEPVAVEPVAVVADAGVAGGGEGTVAAVPVALDAAVPGRPTGAAPGAVPPSAAPPVTSIQAFMTALFVGATPGGALGETLAAFTWPEEARPLWPTLRDRIPRLKCGADTKRRYRTSLDSLQRRLAAYRPDPELAKVAPSGDPGAPPRDPAEEAVTLVHAVAAATATIGDLKRISDNVWCSIERQWGGSAADWNHMRRGLSATLTNLFGLAEHPFRRQVMAAIPLRNEGEGRVPDLSPEKFWEVVDAMPAHAQPGVVVLVATGMRILEYERATKRDLKPNIRAVHVPGSKTDGSVGTIFVDETIWPWVEAGIPAPLKRGWLTTHWKRACAEVGVTDVRIHDLRHCLGQWATDAGVDEREVQWALRHRSPGMTRRYTQVRGRRNVARAAGAVLTASRRGTSGACAARAPRRRGGVPEAAGDGDVAGATCVVRGLWVD